MLPDLKQLIISRNTQLKSLQHQLAFYLLTLAKLNAIKLQVIILHIP
jgi:hypothetical protein